MSSIDPAKGTNVCIDRDLLRSGRSPTQVVHIPDATSLFEGIDPRVFKLMCLLNDVSVARGVILPGNIVIDKSKQYFPYGKDPLWGPSSKFSQTGGDMSADRKETWSWRDSLSQLVYSALGERQSPKSVFYPFPAFDLATVVTAFASADVYILADSHPLLVIPRDSENLPDAIRYSTDMRMGIHYVISVGELNMLTVNPEKNTTPVDAETPGILQLLLGNMKAFYPDFQVNLIQYFAEALGKDAGYPVVHGVISFNLGNGTRQKTAIFINTRIKPEEPFITVGRSQIGVDLGFVDGLMGRGDMFNLMEKPDLSRFLMKLIHDNGGVVVGGVKGYGRLWDDNDSLPRDTKESYFPDFHLSYFKGMEVVTFPSPSNSNVPSVADSIARGGVHVFCGQNFDVTSLLGGGRVTPADIVHLGGLTQAGVLDAVAGKVRVNETLAKMRQVLERARETSRIAEIRL